jgi:hypothetical protein
MDSESLAAGGYIPIVRMGTGGCCLHTGRPIAGHFSTQEDFYTAGSPSHNFGRSGPYRLTRNPMYLSLALLYAGIAILYQSIWALLLLFPVLFIIDRHVIVLEELYLERRFGSAYARYRTRVRRWI